MSNNKRTFIFPDIFQLWTLPDEANSNERHTIQEKPFPCNLCEYGAKTKYKLKAHIENKHSLIKDKSKNHVCNQCCRRYRHKQSLISHLKHECGREKPFNCHLCDYRAKLKHHVKSHFERVHLQARGPVPEHVCPRCNKRYPHHRTLTSHLIHDCGK